MEVIIYAILSVKSDSEKPEALLNTTKGISRATLSAVYCSEICAVVSNCTKEGLSINTVGAIEYAGVIESLAQNFTLLPMRFGSMMESTEAIHNMLEKNYSEIQNNLVQVENKLEFGLKVFCDSEKLRADLMARSAAETQTAKPPLPEIKTSVYREWVNKKLKEHRLEEMLLSHVDAVITTITDNLTRMDAVCKFKKMLSETMIIDAVFLIEKRLKNHLIQEIEEVQNIYPGLNFVLTGPWPPYNFVETTIK